MFLQLWTVWSPGPASSALTVCELVRAGVVPVVSVVGGPTSAMSTTQLNYRAPGISLLCASLRRTTLAAFHSLTSSLSKPLYSSAVIADCLEQ